VGNVLIASSSVLEIADAGVGSGLTVVAICTMVDVTVGAVGVGDQW
jgi:hypothetical protein